MLTTPTVPSEIVVQLSPVPETEVELPHDQMCVSQTAAQIIRRKKFKQKSLQLLADSIAIQQLQAILVRPLPMMEGIPRYEIVFGERRWLASQIAKRPTIRALVWVMTDEEALNAQLAENLDRDDLDPFAEAAGYQDLLKTYRLTHQQIAARYDHSVRHVINRLLLLQLAPAVQAAFDTEEIGIESVNLIARVPHHELQLEALEIARQKDATGESTSPGRLRLYIKDNLMLELKGAPFDTADPALIPDTGPCGTCPKRTGNQNVLFSDIKGPDICTDPTCFKQKREASWVRKREQARSQNQIIIEGSEAKKIAPHGNSASLRHGYIALDSICHAHPNHKTFRELLGRVAPVPDLLEMPQTKDLIEVVRGEAIAPILEKKGVKLFPSPSRPSDTTPSCSDEHEEKQRRREAERDYRRTLFQQIRAKHPATPATRHLRMLATAVFFLLPEDDQRRLLRLLNWAPPPQKITRIVKEHLDKLEPNDLVKFMMNCVLVREAYVSGYSIEPPALMKQFAADYGINPRTVRAACVKEATPKKKRAAHTPPVKAARAADKRKAAKVQTKQPTA